MEENKQAKCPNPNGETGICYNFDRFGDRCGCVGCPLLETIPGGMFAEGDPLPGLTELLKTPKEGDLNPKTSTKVHYGLDGQIMDCNPKSYIYIQKLENIINKAIEQCKAEKQTITEKENFYKECQRQKDDYASELHLLLTSYLAIDNIQDIMENKDEKESVKVDR